MGSGIRYDLLVDDYNKNNDGSLDEYLEQVVTCHISGRLKVAPEHTSDATLRMMRKPSFKHFHAFKEKYEKTLMENTSVFCHKGKLVVPRSLQHRAVSWYHHYLQHPGNTRLEETIKAAMYWKDMRSTVRSYVKKCRSYQVNKRRSQKYGKLPTKLAIITPWEAVCVDLIGPYTLRGKDKTEIDFMCLTMIDPASSWFEIVELPVVELAPTSKKKTRAETLKMHTLTNLRA